MNANEQGPLRAPHSAAPHLALDRWQTDRPLARRLPRQLALSFRAIPVAESDERITVAMADPDDDDAAAAIAASLGRPLYIVQGDGEAIDEALRAVWLDGDRLRMLVCGDPAAPADELGSRALLLGGLLDAEMACFDSSAAGHDPLDALAAEARRGAYDLVVVGPCCQPLLQRLLAGSLDCRALDRIPASLLFAHCGASWPIKSILLVVDGEENTQAALDWTIRIALASAASITTLAVVPPVPAMFGHRPPIWQGIAGLLRTETPLGRELRHIAHEIEENGIEGTLRLCEGAPGWQIPFEAARGAYDLLVTAADPAGRWLRWLRGETVNTLVRCISQPLLVARAAAR